MITSKTLAEQFKLKRQADYADLREFMGVVSKTDSKASFCLIDGRVMVMFSDGSQCRLGDNDH